MEYKITALNLQKRNPNRVNVYLNGKFAFGLARIVAAWLQVDQKINDEKITQLKAEDAGETAYQRALKYISHRQRSEDEVRRNLGKHNVPEKDIEFVIERLKRSDLVNDIHFAQSWVENRSELHPRGRRALAYELRKKGIDSQIIDQVLTTVDDEPLADKAARERVRKFKGLDWPEFRQKMYRYLSQRGFNYETISQVVIRVWDEELKVDYGQEEEEYL